MDKLWITLTLLLLATALVESKKHHHHHSHKENNKVNYFMNADRRQDIDLAEHYSPGDINHFQHETSASLDKEIQRVAMVNKIFNNIFKNSPSLFC